MKPIKKMISEENYYHLKPKYCQTMAIPEAVKHVPVIQHEGHTIFTDFHVVFCMIYAKLELCRFSSLNWHKDHFVGLLPP